MTLPSTNTWEKLLAIVDSEDTELARDLHASVVKLRSLGEQNRLAEYDSLAVELDKKFMELTPVTLDKFVDAFEG